MRRGRYRGGEKGRRVVVQKTGPRRDTYQVFLELFRILRVEGILEVSIRLVTGLFYHDVGVITRNVKRRKRALEVLAIDD
jgi:hypothetical protein